MNQSHATQKPDTALTVRSARLDELPSRTFGIVHQIDQTDAGMHRLMAMGLCVSREIEVVRQGNPLIVRLLGARVGISSRLARLIVVAVNTTGGH